MACKWCITLRLDGDCLQCDSEREARMHHEPLATFKTDDPIDMELAKKSIGREALEKAFSDGGGGIKEIFENLKNATQIQALRKLGDEDKL